MPPSPKTILKKVFGYSEFLPLQEEVITNILQKNDTLVVMPTGGGKSLCYQIPALIFPGLTVVVSPLISLMKDQVQQLSDAGVPAVVLNSSLTEAEYRRNLERVRKQQVKLLYVAPESLLTARLFSLLNSVQVDCLTIDEAHCISEWGHDFRPEYRQLADVRARFPQAVCVALTATATPRVQDDIQKSLRFERGSNNASQTKFVASFNRPNLFLEVRPKRNATGQTIRFLKKFINQSGIIYCFSRRQVDELYEELDQHGFSVRPYHAGLSDEERKQNQELFIRDDVQIIVATIAFGMGINKPNVRFVVHYDLPKNIESYYQEIGRAGRDGLPAHCLLLFSYGDLRKIKYFIKQKTAPEQKVALDHLNALIRYSETIGCRRVPLLAHFGETYTQDDCGTCDNCRYETEDVVDLTIPAQKFLSCILRTGERFGRVHIADVLLGSQNEKVRKFNHDQLSTYGIGKELDKKQWMDLSNQLLAQNLLRQDEKYGGLSLSEKGHQFLRNRETFMGRLNTNGAGRRDAAGADQEVQLEYDESLFEILRQKRKELADARKVPPYVIFSDRTLVEMASFYPLSEASLLKINGVGDAKLKKYGDIYLDLIRRYCKEHGLQERLPSSVRARKDGRSPRVRKPRHIEVSEAYNAGQAVDDLAKSYGVKHNTIINHLYRYVVEGGDLRPGGFEAWLTLSEHDLARAMSAFERMGTRALRPVFDELGGTVSFDDLHIVRLYYITNATRVDQN